MGLAWPSWGSSAGPSLSQPKDPPFPPSGPSRPRIVQLGQVLEPASSVVTPKARDEKFLQICITCVSHSSNAVADVQVLMWFICAQIQCRIMIPTLAQTNFTAARRMIQTLAPTGWYSCL